MALKSALVIFNEADVKGTPSMAKGQSTKSLACYEGGYPTEKIRVRLATYEAGAHELIHWHLIEAFYYVISGHGVMTDIEGKTHEMKAGTVVYCPPGIAGSHSWKAKEGMQLISFRATTDPEKTIQFDVDLKTMESSISLKRLERVDITRFHKSLY